MKCKECKKDYDISLKICPNCGYENPKIKNKKIIKIVLYILTIIFAFTTFKSIFIDNLTKIREIENYAMVYGNDLLGCIAYYLNILRSCITFICLLGILSTYYIKSDKLKNKLKIFSIIFLVIFNFLPLMFPIILKLIR